MTLSDLQCRILAALDAIDATAPTPIGELERQADVQFAVGRGAEQRPADEALRGLLSEGRVCLEDGYISLAPVPPRLLVTTHQFADLDALASALAVGYITGRAFDLRFDSAPAPHYHAPRVGLYTVDVGAGRSIITTAGLMDARRPTGRPARSSRSASTSSSMAAPQSSAGPAGCSSTPARSSYARTAPGASPAAATRSRTGWGSQR